MGNTCFLSAVLQALAAMAPLVAWLRAHAAACVLDRNLGTRCFSCMLADHMDDVLRAPAGVTAVVPLALSTR